MATYHAQHIFTPGMEYQVWNPKNCRREWEPNPHFCSVCGRPRVHILHSDEIILTAQKGTTQ